MMQPYSLDGKIARYLESVGVKNFTVSGGEIFVHGNAEFRERICGVITRKKLDMLAERVKAALERTAP